MSQQGPDAVVQPPAFVAIQEKETNKARRSESCRAVPYREGATGAAQGRHRHPRHCRQAHGHSGAPWLLS